MRAATSTGRSLLISRVSATNASMAEKDGNGIGGILARLGAFIAVAVAGALISHYTHVGQYLTTDRLEEVAKQLGGWGPLVILVLGLLTPLIFLPRWPLAFIGGILYGLFWGTLLATFASTLGAWLHYGLSRSLLAPMTSRLKAKYRLERLHVPHNREFLFIFLLRAFPLSSFVMTNLIAGALRMRPLRYVVASFLGMIPSSLMYAAGGKLVKKPEPHYYYVAIGIVVAFIAATAVAQRFVRPWLRQLRGDGEDAG